MLRLHQCAGGHIGEPIIDKETGEVDFHKTHEVDDSKEQLLEETLREIDPADPVVIVGRFRHDLEIFRRVSKRLGRNVFEQSGRRKERILWQQSSGGDVLAAQIRSACEAIDLTRARYCILFSVGFSRYQFVQMKGRLDRPGQTQQPHFIRLVAAQTIDEHIYKMIATRENVAQEIMRLMKAARVVKEKRFPEFSSMAKQQPKETETALARTGAGGAGGQIVKVDNYAIMQMAAGAGKRRHSASDGRKLRRIGAIRIRLPTHPSSGGRGIDLGNGRSGNRRNRRRKDIRRDHRFMERSKGILEIRVGRKGRGARPAGLLFHGLRQGTRNPGVLCAQCPFNVFGTAKNNTARGKACKDVRLLFMVREGDILPELVPIPPTSIKAAKAYFMRLAGRGIPYWRAITRFSLVKDKNTAGIEYARVSLECVGIVDETNVGVVKDYSETVKGMLGKATVQVKPGDIDGKREGNPEPARPTAGRSRVNSTCARRGIGGRG
jgi:hypothetical protein